MTRRQTILLILCGVAMFHLLLVIIFGDNGLVEFNRMRITRNNLLNANEQLTRENAKLYRAIDRLQNDPVFIENTARHELGMIRSDELIFKFSGKNPNVTSRQTDQHKK